MVVRDSGQPGLQREILTHKIDRWMEGWIDGWVDEYIDRYIDRQTDGWTDRYKDLGHFYFILHFRLPVAHVSCQLHHACVYFHASPP